jgi:two-component system KDP operon response regulator KdpE
MAERKLMPIKVLVIDDDIAITELLTMLLKTHGFDVITANSGVEGVQLAREKLPGVVLLDLMMPDLDGWEVCKAIRTFSNLPILILSALNDPRMVASVLDSGADDFLVKPVSSSILVAHLRRLVRRTGSLTATPSDTRNLLRGTHPLLS